MNFFAGEAFVLFSLVHFGQKTKFHRVSNALLVSMCACTCFSRQSRTGVVPVVFFLLISVVMRNDFIKATAAMNNFSKLEAKYVERVAFVDIAEAILGLLEPQANQQLTCFQPSLDFLIKLRSEIPNASIVVIAAIT